MLILLTIVSVLILLTGVSVLGMLTGIFVSVLTLIWSILMLECIVKIYIENGFNN